MVVPDRPDAKRLDRALERIEKVRLKAKAGIRLVATHPLLCYNEPLEPSWKSSGA